MKHRIAMANLKLRQGRQNLAQGVVRCEKIDPPCHSERSEESRSAYWTSTPPTQSEIPRFARNDTGLVLRRTTGLNPLTPSEPRVASAAPSPCPLPREVGEGEQKGVGAIFPRACALG